MKKITDFIKDNPIVLPSAILSGLIMIIMHRNEPIKKRAKIATIGFIAGGAASYFLSKAAINFKNNKK